MRSSLIPNVPTPYMLGAIAFSSVAAPAYMENVSTSPADISFNYQEIASSEMTLLERIAAGQEGNEKSIVFVRRRHGGDFQIEASEQTDQWRNNLDNLLGVVRSFGSLEAGWSGPDSLAPKSNAISDAVVVAQAWPRNIPLPTPDLDADGNVALDIIGENGLALAGFGFPGEDHSAVLVVMDGSKVKFSRYFDTESATDIIKLFQELGEEIA